MEKNIKLHLLKSKNQHSRQKVVLGIFCPDRPSRFLTLSKRVFFPDKEERVVSSIKVLKRKITEVEEEAPQETVIPTKKNKKTIDKEAEKGVQASTSSDI
ncbi:hypothetical protein BpHYR1_054692, partial [Brachionus plicatilis]